MDANGNAPDARLRELAELVRRIRSEVQRAHPGPGNASIRLADLMPAVHARDAAEAKVASIGWVNPRPPGLVNRVIQGAKQAIARSLGWFVREQVAFNRGLLRSIDALIEAHNETNRAQAELAGRLDQLSALVSARLEPLQSALDECGTLAQQVRDLSQYSANWRAQWESRLDRIELEWRRTAAEQQQTLLRRAESVESAANTRLVALETAWRSTELSWQRLRDQWSSAEASQAAAFTAWEQRFAAVREAVAESLQQVRRDFEQSQLRLHGDYRVSLDQAASGIQQQLWSDLARVQDELRGGFAQELRQIRQRTLLVPALQTVPPLGSPPEPVTDWLLFAEKFRGSEDSVRQRFAPYVAQFAGRGPVLDLGCGRGEFLQLLQQAGIPATGIDSSGPCVALCRGKGLAAEQADLFTYLELLPDASLGGIFCAQVIEHLPPALVPRLVQLAAAKLAPGSPIIFETPNPGCLAIFATHFFLDPTHVRPVPPPLMQFYLEEAGFTSIEVTEQAAAVESMPALATLPEKFRQAFFGGLDYSIRALRLPSFRNRS